MQLNTLLQCEYSWSSELLTVDFTFKNVLPQLVLLYCMCSIYKGDFGFWIKKICLQLGCVFCTQQFLCPYWIHAESVYLYLLMHAW